MQATNSLRPGDEAIAETYPNHSIYAPTIVSMPQPNIFHLHTASGLTGLIYKNRFACMRVNIVVLHKVVVGTWGMGWDWVEDVFPLVSLLFQDVCYP